MNVILNGKTTQIGPKDESLNHVNIKGELTPKLGIQEMYGSLTPQMQCNYSTSLSSPPTWTMNFDKEYSVKSVKLFNIRNGALKSNLEDSTIYVGNVECAKMGSTIPENQYIVVEC